MCNDPPPNVFGKECKGSAVYEGPCNDFPCGLLSPGTIYYYSKCIKVFMNQNVFEKKILFRNKEKY